MIKAAIYIRISTDDQSDYSLDKQERDCRAEAERRGWHVHHVYTDEGISAKNDPTTRPAHPARRCAGRTNQSRGRA